eukprot:scaffold34151_cov50-Phaeocystis_antarctica.AAC.2
MVPGATVKASGEPDRWPPSARVTLSACGPERRGETAISNEPSPRSRTARPGPRGSPPARCGSASAAAASAQPDARSSSPPRAHRLPKRSRFRVRVRATRARRGAPCRAAGRCRPRAGRHARGSGRCPALRAVARHPPSGADGLPKARRTCVSSRPA